MRFDVIASGSGGNAYAVTVDGSMLLIEAGIRFKDLQRALQFRVSSLAFALCSHEHMDHARAVPDVMKAGVPVYATRGTFDALGVRGHRAHAITPLQPFRVGDWRILAFPAVHDAAEPVGFLIQAPDGQRCLYSTDSSYLPYRFDPCDVIAIEANYSMRILQERLASGDVPPAHYARIIRNHCSIETAIEALKANDLSRCRRIVALHLSDGNSSERGFADQIRRATGIPVEIAPARATERSTA